MKTTHVLCAGGSAMTRKIDIMLTAGDAASAIEQASAIGEGLCKAGYYSFALYRKVDEYEHILISAFSFEQQPAKIVFRG